MPVHVSSTSAHRQEAKIVLYNLWYHHTETNSFNNRTNITLEIQQLINNLYDFMTRKTQQT